METFKTMLAKPANYSKFNFEGAVLQTKLDGMRCYITKDGMFSRAHKPVLSAPHIIKALKPFFDEYGDDVILDGELYNHKFADDFNKIISLARKTKPTAEHLERICCIIAVPLLRHVSSARPRYDILGPKRVYHSRSYKQDVWSLPSRNHPYLQRRGCG